jgi:hypothetical protein
MLSHIGSIDLEIQQRISKALFVFYHLWRGVWSDKVIKQVNQDEDVQNTGYYQSYYNVQKLGLCYKNKSISSRAYKCHALGGYVVAHLHD